MAPTIGPLGPRVLLGKRDRVGVASGKIAADPRCAGKEGKAFRIAFTGRERVAKADHQTVPGRYCHLRLRSVWRGPRDSRLTGDNLGIAGVGGDDDAELPAIARDTCSARVERALRCGDELSWVGASRDGAREAPLA